MIKKKIKKKIKDKYACPFTGRKWCMTLNTHSSHDYEALTAYFNSSAVVCACIAKEYGRHRIHPHWQIYFELVLLSRNIKTTISNVLGHANAYLTKANGTKASNIAYVYGLTKPYEIGEVVFSKNCEVPPNYDDTAVKFWASWKPRPFQKAIIDLITSKKPDRRTIYWFYDVKGASGKSILCEYLMLYHGAIVTGIKGSDMKHAIVRYQEITKHSPIIICLNMARSATFSQSTALSIEEIKDGMFFSGKYKSSAYVAINKPYVFIFSNHSPAKYKNKNFFTPDRWRVYRIRSNKHDLKHITSFTY